MYCGPLINSLRDDLADANVGMGNISLGARGFGSNKSDGVSTKTTREVGLGSYQNRGPMRMKPNGLGGKSDHQDPRTSKYLQILDGEAQSYMSRVVFGRYLECLH